MMMALRLVTVLTFAWLALPIVAVGGVAFCEPAYDGEVGAFGSGGSFREVHRLGLFASIVSTAPAAFVGSVLATSLAFMIAALVRLESPAFRRIVAALMAIPMLTSIVPRALAVLDVLDAPGLAVWRMLTGGLAVEKGSAAVAVDGATVGLGFAYTYAPYLFFVFWAALEELSDTQIAAARDSGASTGPLLRRLLWPSVEKLAAGTWLVSSIVMTLDIVVPSLFGNGKTLYVGPAVEYVFFRLRDRSTAVALMIVGIGVAALLTVAILGLLYSFKGAWALALRRHRSEATRA